MKNKKIIYKGQVQYKVSNLIEEIVSLIDYVNRIAKSETPEEVLNHLNNELDGRSIKLDIKFKDGNIFIKFEGAKEKK